MPNRTNAAVRMLTIFAPAGFKKFYMEIPMTQAAGG